MCFSGEIAPSKIACRFISLDKEKFHEYEKSFCDGAHVHRGMKFDTLGIVAEFCKAKPSVAILNA